MKELEKRIAALEEIVRLQGLTIARLQSAKQLPVLPVLPVCYPPFQPYVVTCEVAP